MYISIIVPCFNEEKVIKKFYNEITKLMKNKYQYELVFVNDGSSDRTVYILKELSLQDSGVKYISFSRNFGKEAAMLAGLKYSKGNAVIIMDADLQHPPKLIPELIKGFEEGYDQVIAKRDRKGDAFVKSLFCKLYYRIMNNFVDVMFTDGAGDFRLLSRKAVEALLSLNEYNRFSKGLFYWIGFKEKVIEYENTLREDGESKWTFSKLLNYGIDGIISFNNKPLRIGIYLGLIATAMGILYIFSIFFRILLYGIQVPGYFTMISSVLLLGGIQLIFLGVIGEYIGRIYYESKQRPHFIIDEENIMNESINNEIKSNKSIAAHQLIERRKSGWIL